MMRDRWISLLLTLVLLWSLALPVRAAGTVPSDDQGGLSVPPQEERVRRPVTDPAPADDTGGLADPDKSTPANDKDSGKKDPAPQTGTAAGRGTGVRGGSGTMQDGSQASQPEEKPVQPPKQDPAAEGEVAAGVSLETERHIAYVQGKGDSFPAFHPWREVTRAELAVMLSRLLPADTPASPSDFTDVPEGSWCYDAVSKMSALGVMTGEDGIFGADTQVSRGEFIRCLSAFFPLRTDAELFPDVEPDDANASAIISARAYGWTQGDKDGLFKPDDILSRGEAVVMLNRALGRSADKDYINSRHPAFYTDVSPAHWFYYDVMEATVAHAHTENENGGETWSSHTAVRTAPATGFHLVDGWLYYYDAAKGDILRSGEVQGRAFNAAGHFTSGNANLDQRLHDIVAAKTNASMSQEEMLRALYLYTRDSFKYLRRPAYAFGATGFMVEDALRILETGYGNCYCYASLFWFLSRWIGYDSIIYSGTVGQNRAPHSWVEIAFDGRNYIFDTELEMAYRRKRRFDVDLYKFLDSGNSWRYVRP